MVVNCPKCKKSLVNEQLKKLSQEYENKIKDSIKDKIQDELREDFKKKLEDIDKRFHYNDSNSFEKEHSKILEEIKQLEQQRESLNEKMIEISHKTSSIKNEYKWTYEWMNRMSKLDYWKSLLRSFEQSLASKKDFEKIKEIHEKEYQQLHDKYKKWEWEIGEIDKLIGDHSYLIKTKKEEIQKIKKEITSLKEKIYETKLEEEKWKEKNDVLKRALED